MRNYALITIDSLRFDVFKSAKLPFLKSFKYEKAFTHGTYTLPAHASFFVGKLPCTFSGDFDTLARANRDTDSRQIWRLSNPESPGPCEVRLEGKNIIDGFNKLGYNTFGTGGVSWFNENKPAYIPAIRDFKYFKYFGIWGAQKQFKFITHHIKNSNNPYFYFINFGETHHPFKRSNKDVYSDYGDRDKCFNAQKRCLEYLDPIIKDIIDTSSNITIIICSDHGECMGENGLWGHSFYHEKIIEVPILKIIK